MVHVTYADKVRAERALNLAALDIRQAALAAVLQERIDTDAKEASDTADELANWKQAAADARDTALDAKESLDAMAESLRRLHRELEAGGRMNRGAIMGAVEAAADAAVRLVNELDDAADLLA